MRACLYACNQSELWVNWRIQIVRACMYACAPHNEREAGGLGLWDVRFNRVWMFEGFVVVVVDSSLRTCTQHALVCEFFSDLQQESCAKRSAGTGACREGRRQGMGGGERCLMGGKGRGWWIIAFQWPVEDDLMRSEGETITANGSWKISPTKRRTLSGHWCHCEVTCGLLKEKVRNESD